MSDCPRPLPFSCKTPTFAGKCPSPLLRVPDAQVMGGDRVLPARDYDTQEKCKRFCVNDAQCQGVDFNLVSSSSAGDRVQIPMGAVPCSPEGWVQVQLKVGSRFRCRLGLDYSGDAVPVSQERDLGPDFAGYRAQVWPESGFRSHCWIRMRWFGLLCERLLEKILCPRLEACSQQLDQQVALFIKKTLVC